MMAREILAIQAAGVGIEREFSIAGNFNLDNRTYSAEVLSALMVSNHAMNEENRVIRMAYYLQCRVEVIKEDDIEAEDAENNAVVIDVLQNIATIDISDGEDEDYEEVEERVRLEASSLTQHIVSGSQRVTRKRSRIELEN
jgi:hypothetical protein